GVGRGRGVLVWDGPFLGPPPRAHPPPPGAMRGAQSGIRAPPANSPWISERTSRIFRASTAGTCPAFNVLRQDRNSIVGTMDRMATMMNTANFVRKAWLEK